ncbi:hypothetical protein HYH02_012680 [Chlamydomonas schloesseri]|uniref:Uncharacterized protein n=1 Tax=Chlamydomonas schloesseri TaxID=2026947 RepID=A0A835T0K1_9CHLO|nr:hypothetical protein HYH02_012680 [Chlamydomonas schloesseri]|eukprot:KAG2433563.1 hypothetical protein HYH02_012680 [Chlamydomonas schloesseri]
MLQQGGPLRSVTNTSGQGPLTASLFPAGKQPHANGSQPTDVKGAPSLPFTGLMQHHVVPAGGGEASNAAGGPAAKRPRVEDVLQQHAPREQLLVSELMGWRGSQQEPSAMGASLLGTATTAAAGGGHTDFRALFARGASQAQAPTAQQAPAPQTAPGGLCAVTARLRTFADVATRPAVGPEDVGRMDVMGAMRAAYTTAGPAAAAAGAARGPGCDGGAGPGPGTVAGVGAGAAPICLENLTPEQVPVDWSIKRSLTFSSRAPFTVHERAQQAPARARWRAMQGVVNLDLDSLADDPAAHYLGCQLSWRHPEVVLDPASICAAARSTATPATAAASAPGGQAGGATNFGGGALASNGGGSAGVLTLRLAAWRGALHSLYSSYRSGTCEVFYVVNPAPKGSYAALFASKGIRGCKDVCAVVSQSTRLLRNRLTASGVPFTMPLHEPQKPGAALGAEAGPATSKAEEQADGDLCDENPQNNASVAHQVLGVGVADNSRQSLLLMRGPRAVHGLYDFFLNDTSYPGLGKSGSTGIGLAAGASATAAAAAQEDVADLPMLLAPAPFEGGSAWRPTVKMLTMANRDGASAGQAPSPAGTAAGNEAAAVMHVLQLTGPLPPWTVWRMCGLLSQLQHAGYSATMEAEAYSIPLNSAVLEQAARGEAGAEVRPIYPQGGAVKLEELLAWRQPVALAAGRPVKGVTCSELQRLCVRL